MKIHLHIGLEGCGVLRLQEVLADKRAQLEGKGVLFPRGPGPKNHTRLFMAVTDPDRPEPLRMARGFGDPDRQEELRSQIAEGLARDVARAKPDVLILSAAQLGVGLTARAELERLRDMLTPLSDDITVTAHLDDPARLLAWNYAAQVFEGRARGLDLEIGLMKERDWWQACMAATPRSDPDRGVFSQVQGPAFWLDYQALEAFWEGTFGAGAVRFRRYDPARWSAPEVTEELRAAFDIRDQIGKAEPWTPPQPPSAEWLARSREMNDLLIRLLALGDHVLPRPLWRKFLEEIRVGGAPIDPASLAFVAGRFSAGIQALNDRHPDLDLPVPEVPPGRHGWGEPAPHRGFRASQYLLAWLWRVERATTEAAKADHHASEAESAAEDAVAGLSKEARAIMSPLAVEKYASLQRSSFKPHNRLGRVNEEDRAAPYAPAAPRALPPGSTGRVIVGCMKNEAPYIVEWVAYHRAIGFDNFLIYTNDCTDGTDTILQRLDQMGIVQHRNNDNWSGQSPQQCALDAALEEPVLQQAEWIAHIDVDEFVNVRCGNGTLDDFLAAVPEATNVAMTWRLFGHGGVTDLADRPVIEQFTACAPKFCPKPHTVWGFKTLFRNIGAYSKMSCHRPNKLNEEMAGKVMWVNGNGSVTTKEMLKNGWRSSKSSIGYDLLQLNHYALRSADSYLIKRQRGRALHVDRSIGLNYWIRMDWCDYTDVTIQRNLPRLRAEMDRLLADPELRRLHDTGFAWHQAKAAELHDKPEFQELYEQALKIRLNEAERVAYALAQDLES
ncbi:glycosyltransferase family 2 protein [Pseudooceanicola sp.]|uniref:glycosyltransferase family 2 protein n=1 Tax=Pseudooceanicola sp. TaxID=1914328 RepID=UPI0035C6EEE5